MSNIKPPVWAKLTNEQQKEFEKLLTDAHNAYELGYFEVAEKYEDKAFDYALRKSSEKNS